MSEVYTAGHRPLRQHSVVCCRGARTLNCAGGSTSNGSAMGMSGLFGVIRTLLSMTGMHPNRIAGICRKDSANDPSIQGGTSQALDQGFARRKLQRLCVRECQRYAQHERGCGWLQRVHWGALRCSGWGCARSGLYPP